MAWLSTPSGTLTQLGTHPPFRFPLKEEQPLALWLLEDEVSGQGRFLAHLASLLLLCYCQDLPGLKVNNIWGFRGVSDLSI